MTDNDITGAIVDAAYRIHTKLGPGLLESAYEAILVHELDKRGLKTVRQAVIPVTYDGFSVESGFRADVIVEGRVVVEVKSVESIAPVHKKQLLTYLKLADKRVGLLINFNVYSMKDGITRIANRIPDSESSIHPQP